MHLSMFKKDGDKLLQCVIKSDFKEAFEKLGFADSADKAQEEKPKRTTRTKKAD